MYGEGKKPNLKQHIHSEGLLAMCYVHLHLAAVNASWLRDMTPSALVLHA